MLQHQAGVPEAWHGMLKHGMLHCTAFSALNICVLEQAREEFHVQCSAQTGGGEMGQYPSGSEQVHNRTLPAGAFNVPGPQPVTGKQHKLSTEENSSFVLLLLLLCSWRCAYCSDAVPMPAMPEHSERCQT